MRAFRKKSALVKAIKIVFIKFLYTPCNSTNKFSRRFDSSQKDAKVENFISEVIKFEA
jgi:hypothetical protein